MRKFTRILLVTITALVVVSSNPIEKALNALDGPFENGASSVALNDGFPCSYEKSN